MKPNSASESDVPAAPGGAAFKDYCSQALATGGDGDPVTFFRFRAQSRMGPRIRRCWLNLRKVKARTTSIHYQRM